MQVDALVIDKRDFLKPTVTIKVMIAAVNWPKLCMANRTFIMAPLHFLITNSQVIIEGNGWSPPIPIP